MTDSQKLLAEYVKEGSEPAFRELVTRYIDFVHASAVRLVNGDTHLAEDVCQTVFADLARKAHGLSANVMLGGWLHRHTCFVAATLMRGERRRQLRERRAAQMNAEPDHTEANLAQLAPVLDEAINQLAEDDRAAILLRFFERRDLRSVGAALGTNEDAARKRVDRALDKLHSLLKHRGVTFSVAGLGTLLLAEAASAAPTDLADAVIRSSLAQLAATKGGMTAIAKIMSMTKIQIGAGALIGAGLITGLVVQARSIDRLQTENAALQETNRVALALPAVMPQPQPQAAGPQLAGADQSELLRLRSEVGRLRQELAARPPATPADPTQLTAEELPPVASSSVIETARDYAFLVRKLEAGQITPAEEYNLAKAQPYLKKRFVQDDNFANFESQYLAALGGVTNEDAIWSMRRVLEQAREEEGRHGLGFARMSEDELKKGPFKVDIVGIREKWNRLNDETMTNLMKFLADDEARQVRSGLGIVLDFDPRLSRDPMEVKNDPKFQGLSGQEISQAWLSLSGRDGTVSRVPAVKAQ